MKFFVLYAHPDPNSLTGSLHADSIDILRDLGHEVTVSDLYAMKWNPVADYDDFTELEQRTNFMDDSGHATVNKTLHKEILTEQAKIAGADAVILQFPLWWFGTPAIMKGWFDRVLTKEFGYGGSRDWPRYGQGVLAGKRALVMTTMGASNASVSDRGVSGDINDLLFPLLHGTIYYTGMQPLQPFVVSRAFRTDEERYQTLRSELQERLANWNHEPLVGYRSQNGGDYDERLRLKPGLEKPDVTGGYQMHVG